MLKNAVGMERIPLDRERRNFNSMQTESLPAGKAGKKFLWNPLKVKES